MPKDNAPITLDRTTIREARNFLERLQADPLPRNHFVANGVRVTTPVRKRKPRVERRDLVATAAMDQDDKAVRQDVAAAMTKIRSTLLTLKTMRDSDLAHPAYRPGNEDLALTDELLESLHEDGRDRLSYAAFTRKSKLDELLAAWDESWSVENTAGLLLDMSRSVRPSRTRSGDEPPQPGDAETRPDAIGRLLSPGLVASRGAGSTVDKHSDWYQDLPADTKTQSGASASTAILLLMLEDLDVPLGQVEAIVNGLVKFWDRPLRRATGRYHSAAEVWAVYNEHLEGRLRHQWAANQRDGTEEEEEDD